MRDENAGDPDDAYRAYAPPAPAEEEDLAAEPSSPDEPSPTLTPVQWSIVILFFSLPFAILLLVVFVIVSVVTGRLP